MAVLTAGSQAPDFDLPTDGKGRFRLSDRRGKNSVVLYFYPKDDTTGCTREAIDFNGLKAAFADAKTEVVGISIDSPASHDKFKAKYDLGFALASDEEKKVAEAYGVWAEKSMYGRKYMGVERTTFLIDRAGQIARVWPKVKVAGHAEDVLEQARGLG